MKTTKKQRILLLLSSGADIYTVSAKTGENIHAVKKLAKVLK